MKASLRTMRNRFGRWAGGCRAAFGAGGRRAGTKMLLLSDDREYTSEQQFAPMWRHRDLLRRDLGLAIDWLPLDTAMRRRDAALAGWDVIGLKLSFRRPSGEAEAIARWIGGAVAGSTTRLVYFDGDDDSAILWPVLLDLCDLYVKKHVFRDPAVHARRFAGKSNLTDHVARTTGRDFTADIIAHSGGFDPALAERIHLGWNIALDDKIFELEAHPPEAQRTIDVCSRAFVSHDNWLHGLRAPAIAALERLPSAWSVAVPHRRVSQADYYREMRAARICVSPFGYGEICWRDFEAMLSGCLLVKPDMGHIRTAPDLFVPGETYIPVAWDYSDLERAVAPFVINEHARVAIAARAQRRLLESLSADWFVARMAGLLEAIARLDVPRRDG